MVHTWGLSQRILFVITSSFLHCGKNLWKCKTLPLKRNYFAMNYNWYLIFDHLCFNANILQQATQSFCIFMTFFCNCRAYRIITKIIQIFCFGSQNFCTEIQKSCSIQHNYFVYLWIFLAFVWLLKLLQSFCNCVQKYIFNCNSFAKICKKIFVKCNLIVQNQKYFENFMYDQ